MAPGNLYKFHAPSVAHELLIAMIRRVRVCGYEHYYIIWKGYGLLWRYSHFTNS